MRTILIPLLLLMIPCWAQQAPQTTPVAQAPGTCALYPYLAQTHGEEIEVRWASPACELSKVRVYRRRQSMGGEEAEIYPIILIGDRNDTTFVVCSDTLFTELGIYEYRAVPVDSTGTEGPSSRWTIANNLHEETSPWVHTIQVREVPNERSIRLQWILKYPERARGIIIHRAEEFEGPYVHLADVGPGDSTYTDRVQRVKETYFYRIEVIDVVGRSNVSMPVQGLSDTEPIVPPPPVLSAEAEPQGVMLYWSHVGPDAEQYKVERTTPDGADWSLVADGIRAPAEGSVQWMDSSATDGTVYNYRVRTVSIGGPVSEPSMVEVVQAMDATKPSTPTDVVVRRPDDHSVVISWRERWAGDPGVYKANVERADTDSMNFKVLNKEPLEGGVTVFRDSTAMLGKPYSYRVVGLSLSGTQGIPSLPAVLVVKDPLTTGPRMLMAHRKENGISVEWAVRERQGKGLNLYRAVDEGDLKLLKSLPIDASSYVDDAVVEGSMHLYVIALVLPDGTETNPSEPVGVRW
ncbi:MAG: hypothetical protein ABIY71_02160 [Flavobacteriales bacterium]